jgi:dihydroxyacetone kinase
MTSLDASGFSITLLKATPDMLDAIDDVTTAVGWPRTFTDQPVSGAIKTVTPKTEPAANSSVEGTGPKSKWQW